MGNKLHRLAGVPTDSNPKPAHLDPYIVRDAMHTIHKAEEHRRDRPLMREVKKMAKAQAKAVCK